MKRHYRSDAIVVLLGLAVCAHSSEPANPGAHLCNLHRTGYSSIELPTPLQTAWTYASRHRPRPAWKEPVWEPQRIDFDYAFAVSADDRRVYVASSVEHTLTALSLESGETCWEFFTEGPVRLAPEVCGGRVLFGSDDGHVYCLDAATGAKLWQFRPEIPDERLIGNEQMISRWPARSGVLVEGDIVYTTFGMLSPEGIFVCCLDLESGSPVWMNDTSGTHYMARPHVPGMGGVSPQGYLALCGDTLVVPCGRATPALFDKKTGRLKWHEAEGDFTGGAWTMTWDGLVFSPCESLMKEYGSTLRRPFEGNEAPMFESVSLVAMDGATGREVFILQGGRKGVISDDGVLTMIGRDKLIRVRLEDVKAAIGKESTILHTTGHFVNSQKHQLLEINAGVVYSLLQAGDVLIAGGRDRVAALDAMSGRLVWESKVDGQVRSLCLASGRLVASTTSGEVYCYQTAETPLLKAVPIVKAEVTPIVLPAITQEQARHSLALAKETAGYALVIGDVDASYLAAVADQTELTMTCITSQGRDAELRSTLAEAGLYGSRVAVHIASTRPLPYTDYFANVVLYEATSRQWLDATSAGELHRVLRPMSGVAVVRFPEGLKEQVLDWISESNLPEDCWRVVGTRLVIERGKLKGAGEWTHQYADAGKSAASSDQLVRLPLKATWFGGLGPERLVSRHFRTPAPLVIDGRCFVPGLDHLMAMDIYTGRLLWQREMPELAHWPAAYRGPSLAVDHKAVYALQETECLKIDPETGEILGKYEPPHDRLPHVENADGLIWEFLALADDQIIGTLGYPRVKPEWWSKAAPENKLVFAIDKADGHVRWSYRAEQDVDSNAIAVGEGRVYLIEGRPKYKANRRGQPLKTDPRPRVLRALDLQTGNTYWERNDISATQNSLWLRDGVLLSTINPISRGMEDPVVQKSGGGVTAYSAKNGEKLWHLEDVSTCAPVITEGVLYLPHAYGLRSGKPVETQNPLTMAAEHFVPIFPRTCASLSGTPNLLMSRSGSLGFFDLTQQSGYYHYPIIRASCWINMIPAGGLVVIPEGSSSCVCGYNYKTSMALMPAERESHFGVAQVNRDGAIERLLVNFGAPGDRPDEDGRVWFAYPRPTAYGRPLAKARYGPKIAGGKLPIEDLADGVSVVKYAVNPDFHTIDGTDKPWLAASGVEGTIDLRFRLGEKGTPERNYRVTLFFCETDETAQERTFDVTLQGDTVLHAFNVAREAGGIAKAGSRSFIVSAAETLTLECRTVGNTRLPPILSGASIVREK